MGGATGRLALALTGVAAIATPVAYHLLIVAHAGDRLVVAGGWMMALFVAVGLVRAVGFGSTRTAALVGVGIALAYLSAGEPYAIYVPPVAIYGALLWFFGRTLAPGREPLVTAIARTVRGPAGAELERHTRRVTWAWCVFFAVMAVTLTLLALAAPLAVWSFFANVVSYILIGLMFGAEYAYRRWRYPAYQHVSPLRMFSRLARAGRHRPAAPGK